MFQTNHLDRLFSSLFRMLFQIVWFFYLVYTNYLLAAYFNLICVMMGKRYQTVADEIKALVNRMDEFEEIGKEIVRLQDEHFAVCRLMERSNRLWKNYIFFTYV